MKHKKIFVAALLAFAGISANADALYLHIQETNGNWTVINLDEVDKLTFKNNGMQVVGENDNVVKSYSSSALSTIAVNEQQTSAITSIDSDDKTAALELEGKVVKVAEDGKLIVCDIAGRICVEIPSVEAGQTVDLSSLVKGVYVVTLNGSSLKVSL